MVPVADAPGVVGRLAKKGVVVDHRDGKVRVSPYFYNTIDENDTFVKALVSLAPPKPAYSDRRLR
jgi:selenocysteine lyase/cysteine desulfurase